MPVETKLLLRRFGWQERVYSPLIPLYTRLSDEWGECLGKGTSRDCDGELSVLIDRFSLSFENVFCERIRESCCIWKRIENHGEGQASL